MTSSPASVIGSEDQIKALESGAVVAGAVAVVALVSGLCLGISAATNTVADGLDELQHPTLGIGIAIIVVSAALSALAAVMCFVLVRLSQPGRAALREHEIREAERLAAQGW